MDERFGHMGIREKCEFFRARYRSNVENPPAPDPARQIRKSQTVIVVVGTLGAISVLIATVGGQSSVWSGAAAMAMIVLMHLSVIRRMRRAERLLRVAGDERSR